MPFKDIKVQDTQISFLKKAIAKGTVAHAYLFLGIDGIGKALTAKTFAKALNCEKEKGDSCDICDSCRKIDAKNHADILWIIPDETSKLIKINSIRDLQQRISLRAYEAKWKVCIIEDAHLMTAEAENCLLKTLEEPPSNSVIILTSCNLSGLFQTVVSRCQIVKFSPLPTEVIENTLIKKFGFRKETAEFMSRLSNGGIDKKVILEGDDFIAWKNGIIDEFMDGSFFQEDSLMFKSSKMEFQKALSVLINWYRDILICKNEVGEASIINFDRIKDIEQISKKASYEDIDRRLNTLIDANLAITQNVNPKLVIGVLL